MRLLPPWLCQLAALLLLALPGPLLAGPDKPLDESQLLEKTLALRTALHQDPRLQSPYEQLLKTYRDHGKSDALIAIYADHLANYPEDEHATIILCRLLLSLERPDGLPTAERAIQRFAQNDYLHYLYSRFLAARYDPRELDELAKAIELCQVDRLKRLWSRQLLPVAHRLGRKELLAKHLELLATGTLDRPSQVSETARTMSRYEQHEQAIALVEKALAGSLAPEAQIELAVTAASIEASAGKRTEAAKRLDALLERMDADYWQRDDIYSQRLALAESPEEKEQLLEQASALLAKQPTSELATLDLARAHAAFGQRRKALEVLLAAQERIPESLHIEKSILRLYSRLKLWKKQAQFLEARLESWPERRDLREARLLLLFRMQEQEEARADLGAWMLSVDEGERIEILRKLIRTLRQGAMHEEAAGLLESLLEITPGALTTVRELAEIYAATDRADDIPKLIETIDTSEADAAYFGDLIQFLIRQKFYTLSEKLIRKRIETDAANLELRLQLFKVVSKLKRSRKLADILLESRQLADTLALYNRWLGEAIDYYDELDDEQAMDFFLEEELNRLEQERETEGEQLERRLAYARQASRHDKSGFIRQWLEEELQYTADPVQAIAIRGAIVSLHSNPEGGEWPVEEHLHYLMEADPEHAADYQARLISVYRDLQAWTEVERLLEGLDIAKVSQADLLDKLVLLFRAFDTELAIAAVRRLTELDAANLNYWKESLYLMAVHGYERELRKDLRRLLDQTEMAKLDAASVRTLRAHLAESYWRSLLEQMPKVKTHSTALLLAIDEAEAQTQSREEWLRLAWLRAWTHRQIDPRSEEYQAARADFLRVSDERDEEDGDRIDLGDGLSLNARVAIESLEYEPQTFEADSQLEAVGPDGPLRFRYSYVTSTPILQVLPVQDLLLLTESDGAVHAIEAETGRVRWQWKGQEQDRPPELLAHPTEPLLYLAEGRDLLCLETRSGELHWRAPLTSRSGAGQSRAYLYQEGDQIRTLHPETLTLSHIDALSGRCTFEQELTSPVAEQEDEPYQYHLIEQGARRILITGVRTLLYDLELGETLWELDVSRLLTFPLDLEEKRERSLKPLPGSNRYYQNLQQKQYEHYMRVNLYENLQQGGYSYASRMVRTTPMALWQHRVYHDALVSNSENRQYMQAASLPYAVGRKLDRLKPRLLGDYLLLDQQEHLVRMPVPLPIGGHDWSRLDHFAGEQGNRLYYTGYGKLQVLDLHHDDELLITLEDVNEDGLAVQVIPDGPVFYTVGPGGIQKRELASGRLLQRRAWPAVLIDPDFHLEAEADVPIDTVYHPDTALSGLAHGGRLYCSPDPQVLVVFDTQRERDGRN